MRGAIQRAVLSERGVVRQTKREIPCGTNFASRCYLRIRNLLCGDETSVSSPLFYASLLAARIKGESIMQSTIRNIRSSALELKSIYALTICAVLLALRVVLGFVSVGNDTYRITFSHLPVFICAYILGPVPGAIVGALGDIVTLIIKPTGPLNIGITFSEMMVGFISGLFLYRHKVNIFRTTLSCITTAVICSLGITTISILIMYNISNPWIVFVGRVITNAITVPIHIILLFSCQQLIKRIRLPHLTVVK